MTERDRIEALVAYDEKGREGMSSLARAFRPFPDEQFELVISYLSLIDIVDVERAIAEMARVEPFCSPI